MKVLLYSISYSPELAGSGRFNGEMSLWLSEQGHKVDVITAHPYYPEWKVWPSYRGKGWLVERHGKLTVYRTPLFVPNKVTGYTRILHELSFVINSMVHWTRAIFKEYDVVIGVCPPLQIGIFPYIYSSIWRKPFIFHIQDLQVDAARSLNMISSKKLLQLLGSIESYLLKKATWVSSISQGMKYNIISKGVNECDFFMLENWVNINDFKPLSLEKSFKYELGFDANDKIALYSGNLGEKQGLDVLIDAAELLQEDPDIKIVICGEGVSRQRLEENTKLRGLNNVRFFSIRPYEQLPRVLAMADVHLIIQKRAASDLVMPSKLTNVLAMGGAAIVSAEPETWLGQIIIENSMGWVIKPEDAAVLASTIKLAVSSNEIKLFKKNSRDFAIKFLSKDVIMKRFEQFLVNEVVKR